MGLWDMPSPPAPASPDGRCTGRCVRRRWMWRAGQAFNLQYQPSPSTRSRETAIRHVNVLYSSAPTLLGLFRRRIVCDPSRPLPIRYLAQSRPTAGFKKHATELEWR